MLQDIRRIATSSLALKLPPIREAPTQNPGDILESHVFGHVQPPGGHNLTFRRSGSAQNVSLSQGFAKQALPLTRGTHEAPEVSTGSSGPVLPRTYYTRKGALMLYADTITLPPLIDSQKAERTRRVEEDTESSNNGFNSVSSLVRDILHYGSTVRIFKLFIKIELRYMALTVHTLILLG